MYLFLNILGILKTNYLEKSLRLKWRGNMKVLLVNGRPHKEGCTYTALTEVAEKFNKE